jgi:hypothetical protein
MILSPDQITAISLSPTDKWIELARKDSSVLRMHYYGEDVLRYITAVDGLETDDQVELRRKCKISNEFIVGNLLKPFDNLWAAKGGGLTVDAAKTKEKAVIEKIDETGHIAYIKNIFFPQYVTDPNGLLFIENDKQKAWPTFKTIFTIKNMTLNGEIPDYVCFEPDQEEKEDEKLLSQTLWLVDDKYFRRIKLRNGTVEILEEIPNMYGQVPAIVNSGIIDSSRGIRVSPIHKQVDLLNSYLRKNSVKEVYQLKHDYPVYWEYESVCPDCKGSGYIESKQCTTCNGTGKGSKKNVGDKRVIKVPTGDGVKLAPDILGWVNPPWAGEKQRAELNAVFSDMFYSLWGATIEKAQNETATGRFIDVQPVNNALNNEAEIISVRHNHLLTMLCKFYFPETVKKVVYVYGDRYLIETPDQLLDKYNKAKTSGVPDIIKTQILIQYIESEYRRDDLMRNYNLKLIEITPFVHQSIGEVMAMSIPDEDKIMKVYFEEWVNSKQISEIIDKDKKVLKEDLLSYCKTKKLNHAENKVIV